MTAAIIILLIIVGTTIGAYVSVKKGWVHYVFAKKVLHLVAISSSAFSVFLVENHILLTIVGVFLPIVFWLVYKGYFNRKGGSNSESWGVFYFVVVYFILLVAFPDEPKNIFYPLIVLALADGLATLVGYFFGKHKFTFGEETKSWEGSIVFLVSTLVCFALIPSLFPSIGPAFQSFWALLYASLFLTVLEAISPDGRDNLWVPTGVLYYLFMDTGFIDGNSLVVVAVIAAFSFLTVKMRWLTTGGGVVTAIMGCILVISPQPEWVIPAIVFFVVGSLISFLPSTESETQHNPRTAFQVFCNGGVSTFLIGLFLLTFNDLLLFGGLAALAASMSDTISSEFGTRYGKKTYNILTFKSVNAGLSGGVSIIGSLMGTVFLALFCFIPFLIIGVFTLKTYFVIFCAGLLGNLFDSYLGARYQVKYRLNSTAKWSDYSTEAGDEEVRGKPSITNDVVNLLSTILASLFALFLYKVL